MPATCVGIMWLTASSEGTVVANEIGPLELEVMIGIMADRCSLLEFGSQF